MMGDQPMICGICGGAKNPTHQLQNACRCNYNQQMQQAAPWPQYAIDCSEKRIMAKLDAIILRLDRIAEPK